MLHNTGTSHNTLSPRYNFTVTSLYALFSKLKLNKMNESDSLQSLYASYIVNCVFNAFSAYSAIALNILTIHAVRKTSSLPKPLKILLLSLAVSDLGVGLLAQPLHIAEMVNPANSTSALVYTAKAVFIYSSFFSVVAISVDRFLAIHLHLRYQELVTHKRFVAVVISIWVFSAVFTLIWRWVSYVAEYVDIIIQSFCYIITAAVYCKIRFTVQRHAKQMQAQQIQVAQNSQMESDARKRKSAVSTFYVYLVFLVCCLPAYCVLVALLISGPSTALRGVFLYTTTLLYLNSSLNPVIYCWKMRHIRHAVIDILRNIRQNCNTANAARVTS